MARRIWRAILALAAAAWMLAALSWTMLCGGMVAVGASDGAGWMLRLQQWTRFAGSIDGPAAHHLSPI